jgi:DNA-binding NarL/FixJ family response regulator
MVLVDVEMEEMDGREVVGHITAGYPLVRQIALSMRDDEASIIAMLRAGCCAYLMKGIDPDDLEKALIEVHKTGYYNADGLNIHYRRLVDKQPGIQLNVRELDFLQRACGDRTYKQIASDMNLSERTIDGYRESLFGKFKVQSRVGMVLEGIRHRFVKL